MWAIIKPLQTEDAVFTIRYERDVIDLFLKKVFCVYSPSWEEVNQIGLINQ